jgi:hypothetical protein
VQDNGDGREGQEPADVGARGDGDQATEGHRQKRPHVAALPEDRSAVGHSAFRHVHQRLFVEQTREEHIGWLDREDPRGDLRGPGTGELVDRRGEEREPDHGERDHLHPQHQQRGIGMEDAQIDREEPRVELPGQLVQRGRAAERMRDELVCVCEEGSLIAPAQL